MDPSTLATLAPRLLVLAGDQGRPDALVRQAVANLQAATLITLRDYVSPTIYADVVADRSADIGAAMMDFLARMDQVHGTRTVSLPKGEGEVAGISYRIEGSGPPLVLLPWAWRLPNGSRLSPGSVSAGVRLSWAVLTWA